MGRTPERRRGRSDDALRTDRDADARAWRARHRHGRLVFADCLPDEQEMYGAVLRRAGFDPIVTCDSRAAFDLTVLHQADVVITDLSSSDGGLELIKRLRADDRTKGALIIAVSGRAFPADRLAAERAGSDLFLAKPCLPDALVAAIERLLDRRASPGPSS